MPKCKSIIISWAVSYLLILIVPVFMQIFNFFNIREIVTNEINRSSKQLLDSIQYNFDNALNDMQVSSTFIYFDSRLFDLYNADYSSPSFSQYAFNCQNMISNHYSYGNALDVLIYLPKQDFLAISRAGSNISSDIHSTLLARNPWTITYDRFINNLSSRYRYVYMISPYFSYNNYNQTSIVFARTISDLVPDSRFANIFVSIPYSSINAGYADLLKDRELVVFDQNGTPILKSDGFNIGKMTFNANEGVMETPLAGEKYVCTYSQSRVNNWTFAVFAPKNIFWEKWRMIELFSTVISTIIGGEGIIRARELNDETQLVIHSADQKALCEAVDEKDEERACSIAARIYDELELRYPAYSVLKFRIYTVAGVVLDEFYETVPKSDDKGLEAVSLLERVRTAKDPEELRRELIDLTRQICVLLKEKTDDALIDIADDIKNYVNRSYTDYNLNISSIAAAINLSPKFISKAFKDETGVGILDYINNVRIAHAKELMEKGGDNMEVIASKVGYTNVRTFRRVFSKYEGVTPGKYKGI